MHLERLLSSGDRVYPVRNFVYASLVTILATFGGCATPPTDNRGVAPSEDGCGVRITRVQLSAGGGFLDLRFIVLEPERASPLLHPSSKAILIHKRTGKALSVASSKLGNLRQSTANPERGREYFILFRNLKGLVVPGDEVTLIIGPCRFEGLEAQ